jgi:2,4-dienoyl-CoA reductase (NADPH2)
MQHFENPDTVVLAVPAKANASLYFELKGQVPALHRIGDCLAPRQAHAAILEGERVGRLL